MSVISKISKWYVNRLGNLNIDLTCGIDVRVAIA